MEVYVKLNDVLKVIYDYKEKNCQDNNKYPINYGTLLDFNRQFRNLPREYTIDAVEKCHNENNDYAGCDQFVCSECGIELQDWVRVERDENDGDVTYHEYEFRFCPNCGRKVIEE